jgi:glycosyltransferase involved in cell wall biosynthesis
VTADSSPRPLLLGLGWFPTDRTGLNRYLLELGAALDRQGARPRVVVVGPGSDAPRWVDAVSSFGDRLPWRLSRYAAAARNAASDVDVVDGHFALHTAAARTSRAVRRLPLMVHFQGPWAEETRATGDRRVAVVAAKRAVERHVYRRARAVVVLSPAFRRTIVEDYGVDPWRVHVVAPGVDTTRFSPGDREAARASLGIDASTFVVMTARRLVPRTGVDVLLQAWSEIERSTSAHDMSASLLVVGDGPEAGRLREQAKRLGIVGAVRFLGEVAEAELVSAYRSADVCVVPTVALEGFGLVVLEALACGTPVVASDTGGLTAALAPFDRSLLVPPSDPGALAARLLSARDETSALPDRTACRAYAERHSWTRVADRHLALLRACVDDEQSSALRVVYLDHTAQPSGAELSLARTLPELDGVEAHVVVAAGGPLVSLLDGLGCSVEVLPLAERTRTLARSQVTARLPLASAVATAVYVVRLARRLRRLRPDLVQTNSLKSSIYGGLAARLAGVPIVWHLHDRVADDYLPRSAVWLVRWLARRLPDHVLANSHATAATLPDGVPVTVMPEPVEPVGAPAAASRPDAATADGPLRVGIVGRLSPWKGQDLFLRAFARAFRDGEATAVVVGSALFGEHDVGARLRQLATDLGIAGRVEFLGHRDDVAHQLRKLDVLVHASLVPEPFGMVIAEGMAAGLAVVAADAAGPAEIIEPEVNGVLYPIADEVGLATALRALADDPDRRQRLGEAARLRARDFEPSVVARTVREVYESVLQAKRRRAHP